MLSRIGSLGDCDGLSNTTAECIEAEFRGSGLGGRNQGAENREAQMSAHLKKSANKPVPPEVKHRHFLSASIAKSNVYCLFICASVCIRSKLTMNR